jgi:hypothetical protein
MNTTHYKEPTEQNGKQKDGLLLDAISLRDWFAGMAMQAHLPLPPGSHLTTAQFAYLVADAMLKERSKE